MRRLQIFAAGGIMLLVLLSSSVHLLGQLPPEIGSRRRASGAPVAPVFEGWEHNPDGTFTLYFGYFSRNWEEEVDIPIGAGNFFEPAPQDRGQPTHFLPNRQKRNFGIVVPKDFGATRRLTWTLIRGSQAPQRVSGSLDPTYQIEALKSSDGNTAPTLDAGQDQTIVLPQRATLVAAVKDDGLPKRRRGAPPAGTPTATATPAAPVSNVTVQWRLYRAPGNVTFSRVMPAVSADGTASTMVTFSAPGIYTFQAIADDGSAGQRPEGNPGANLCCFSEDKVTVTVKAAGSD